LVIRPFVEALHWGGEFTVLADLDTYAGHVPSTGRFVDAETKTFPRQNVFKLVPIRLDIHLNPRAPTALNQV